MHFAIKSIASAGLFHEDFIDYFLIISQNVVYDISFVSFSAVIAIKKRKKSPLPFYLLF